MRILAKIGLYIMIHLMMTAALSAEERPILTVLDFKGNNIAESEIYIFIDYITSLIIDTGEYRVIDRTQRETLLSEIEFSLTGCTDEACQLEIGRLLSAKYIVTGSLGTVGSRYILNMKMVDIETSETIISISERHTALDDLIDDSPAVVERFLGIDPDAEATVSDAEEDAKTAEIPADEEQPVTRMVELVPTPDPHEGKRTLDYKRHSLEVSAGMVEGTYFSMYGAYSFSFRRSLAINFFIGFYLYEDYLGTSSESLSGGKIIFGDKADSIAFSAGVINFPAYSMPMIGLYFKNFFVDIGLGFGEELMYADAGMGISF